MTFAPYIAHTGEPDYFFIPNTIRKPGEYSSHQQFFMWTKRQQLSDLHSCLSDSLGLCRIYADICYGFYQMTNMDMSCKLFVPLLNQLLAVKNV
jgi:hypothetical protein